MKKSMKKNDPGFSLIEVLVAMAVLVLCVAPLLKAFVVSSQTNAKARTNLNATTLAESIMEEMKAEGVERYGTPTGETVAIEGTHLPVYGAKYSNYVYDGKTYQIEAKMTPSAETYQDGGEKSYNVQSLTKLYRMSQKTDAIYVQDSDDLWDTVEAYADAHAGVDASAVLADTRTEYRFSVRRDSGFDTVEQTITHFYGHSEIISESVETVRIFDSLQTGSALENLYIFYTPAVANQIIIENTTNLPLQVYLVRQGAPAPTELWVEEGGISSPAYTQIRTNLDTSLGSTELTCVRRNGELQNLAAAQKLFGFETLDQKEEKAARLYSVEVTVSLTDGTKLVTLTGTALK